MLLLKPDLASIEGISPIEKNNLHQIWVKLNSEFKAETDKLATAEKEYNRLTALVNEFVTAHNDLGMDLLKEDIPEEKIYITGNTAIDAMKYTVSKNYSNELFDWIGEDKFILLTAHRRENLGEPMRNIFKAIKRIVDEFEDVKVVYPIHMNPRVREVANEIFANCDKVKLIEPLEVFDFHNFQNKSHIILTDSGGIQEEAPSLGKPVLVLRDTTERPEGIAAGTLKLVGTNANIIYEDIINDGGICYLSRVNDCIDIEDGFIEETDIVPVEMDINIVYEDDDVAIVNKPKDKTHNGIPNIATV